MNQLIFPWYEIRRKYYIAVTSEKAFSFLNVVLHLYDSLSNRQYSLRLKPKPRSEINWDLVTKAGHNPLLCRRRCAFMVTSLIGDSRSLGHRYAIISLRGWQFVTTEHVCMGMTTMQLIFSLCSAGWIYSWGIVLLPYVHVNQWTGQGIEACQPLD